MVTESFQIGRKLSAFNNSQCYDYEQLYGLRIIKIPLKIYTYIITPTDMYYQFYAYLTEILDNN